MADESLEKILGPFRVWKREILGEKQEEVKGDFLKEATFDHL